MATATQRTKSILDVPIPSATTGTTPPELEEWWPTEYLEGFVTQADPLADKIMELLYKEGREDALRSGNPADRPRRLLQFLTLLINQMSIPDPEVEHPFAEIDKDYTFSPEVRDAMREFLREGRKLPDWTDFELIEKAQSLFKDNPIVAYVLLACISLPVLYTCGRGGVQILILTDQLIDKVRRRVIETGMLILTVMQKDAFLKLPERSKLTNPLPEGIAGILRVRLLHAATRTAIYNFWQDGLKDEAEGRPLRVYQGKQSTQLWRKEWGKPIHQEYMTGTLMTFSYISLYGLQKLGVLLSDDDKKAYMHFWNVFGYVIGVDKSILEQLDFPRTKRPVYENGKPVHAATGQEMYDIGRALYTQMVTLNRSTDEGAIRDGRVLTNAICDYLTDVLKRRLKLGRYLKVSQIPHLLMAMMLSKDDVELLGVQTSALERAVLIPITVSLFWIRGLFVKAVGKPANAIANLLVKYMQEDIEEVYDELSKKTGVRYPGIPEEFQKAWGLVKS